MIPERRHCLRHKVHGPAFASFDGVTGGMILDLSEEGMAMQTAAPLETHPRIRLHLNLPDPTTNLETTGYIAWADALGRAGVRFSDLPEEARRRLEQWLTLNATKPSLKAPKLSLDDPAWAHRGTSLGREAHEPFVINLELEGETPEKRGQPLTSTTVQYEFASLGEDLNAALCLVSARACALTRGNGAAIALAQDGSMICQASVGACAPALGTRLDVESGFSGECVRIGKPLRCDDAETDPRVDLMSCRRLGILSVLAAPIRYERAIVGVFEVFSTQRAAFDEADVGVAERLAHTVLLAMSRAALLKRS